MRKILLTLTFLAVFVSAYPMDAWAVFQLSASSRRGGQSIRFSAEGGSLPAGQAGAFGGEGGIIMRNEEITLAVETDRTAQYRILQTIYQPFMNEIGNTLPAGAFVMFSPSSPLGTLRTQLETPVVMGQTQIYTSNNEGISDDFVLVFNVRIPENQPGGVYRTQLTYTAEPVNMQAGVSPSVVTIEVLVEINPKFRIDILNEKSTRGLELGHLTKDRRVAQQALVFQITSNVGSTYRIFQQLTEPLVSAEGEILDDESFTFSSSGNSGGSFGAGANTKVPASRSLLYTSTEWGVSDRFQVQYSLVPESLEKAGMYRGNLSFRVESNSPFVSQEVINVPVSMEVESIFSLDCAFARGGGLIFGAFKAGSERQGRQVVFKVHSNLGQPYQITQIVPRKMTTEEGTPLADDNFQFFAENVHLGTAPTTPRPVEQGESVIYTSDKNGTPEEFIVNYTLTIPKDSRAGSYTSEVKYSITTL